jgi:SPP1 gp7 family putative phage head morphogenesis protein
MPYKIRLPKAVRTQSRQNIIILNRDEASALLTNPIEGFTIKEWIAKQRDASLKSLNAVVREGLRSGDTMAQLTERIGTNLEKAKRAAGTLARTAVNQAAADVAQETYSQNPELVSKYKYVAILDSRTSAICRSLDGKEFPLDDPSQPRPPQHFNCRSKIRPVIDWEELGMAPLEVRRKAEGDKATTVGREGIQDTDYESWLHQQSPEFQEEIIGDPDKLKWFQEGKATLGDLVNADGRERTLEELKDVLLDKYYPKLSENQIARLERSLETQIRTFTKAEINALKYYQTGGVDNFLYFDYRAREAQAISHPRFYEDQMKLKRSIDKAFNKSELPQPVTAWRGMSHPDLANMVNKNPDELIGTKIKFDNFLSTSVDENQAFRGYGSDDWVNIEIQAPKDSQAIFIGHKNLTMKEFADQKELLFNRGSSFRVKKAWVSEAGDRHILMEYIK